MKPHSTRPSVSIKEGGVLALSGKATGELLQAVLDKGVPFRFRAKGFSMSPFIKDNDIITVSPLSTSSFQRGEVAAFIHPETKKLYVHRIIEKKGDSYLVKGDNSLETDGFIPHKNIIGCVTCVERKGKKVHLGLGPEKVLITSFTSKRLFFTFLNPIRKFLSFFKKKHPQQQG